MGSFGGGGYYNGQAQHLNPPLVVDASGRVVFVRAVGRLGIWGGEGLTEVHRGSDRPADKSNSGVPSVASDPNRSAVNILSEHICNTPLVVLPAGVGRMAVVCREGLVSLYGD